jgi:ATP-dependent RNA helicase DeaD
MPFPVAHPGLLRAIAERGYTEPTPVQASVLDDKARGRDLLVSAQTGSGKTVAFGLAIAPEITGDAPRVPPGLPRGLVIAPTRELAQQVERELSWLYAPTGARICVCVGGVDPRRESQMLRQGPAIVVGTPGRLRDHLERGNVSFAEIKAVVLDEADEMLDMGFRDELETLLDATPESRRTLLFSATIPRGIAALAKQYQRDAMRIAAANEAEPHGDIEYRAVAIVPRERELAVVNVLRWFEVPGALVFCQTRDGVNHLANNLLERGFSVVALSGELSQAERTRALTSLRDGRARVCVATDVAARGLDLPDLGLVIHADPPRDRATLLHRSGRTGRAGRKGVAVVIIPATGRRLYERIFKDAGVNADWSPPPNADEIRVRDQGRLAADVAAVAKESGDEERAAAKALLEQLSAEDVALALVRMHRERLPAPEDLTPIHAPPPRAPRAHATPMDRGPRPERGQPHGDGGVWFRVGLGRAQNADPRWLIPMLCQRGGITKAEIGAIRIGARETRVEIAPHAADHFAEAIQGSEGLDRRNRSVRIEPLGADEAPMAAGPAGPPPRRGPPVRYGAGAKAKKRSPS